MKKLIYFLSIFLMLACSKEELDDPVLYENLYTIQDDPSDPVKHRIYEIYEKYGAPVYFNDTIGKYYVKDDIYGNPYYRYEKIDLNWHFYSDDSKVASYQIYYQTEPDHQMKSLDFIENLLSDLSKPIQPYAFFVADSITFVKKGSGTGHVRALVQFRSVTLAGLHTATEEDKTELSDEITRSLISMKISRFTGRLFEFYSVSKSAWFQKEWKELGVTWTGTWGPSIFDEWAKKYLMTGTIYDAPWTEEQVEAKRDEIRSAIGPFGFVGGGARGGDIYSPENNARDLSLYMAEILSCDRAEFTRRWGSYPLVMKKYEILYNLLKEELDYEL